MTSRTTAPDDLTVASDKKTITATNLPGDKRGLDVHVVDGKITLWDGTNEVGVTESGQLKVVLDGKVDDTNSSNIPLVASAEFIGTAHETLDYAMIFITVFSDVASAIDGLHFGVSSDGITWRQGDAFTIPAGVEKTFSFQPNKKFYRVHYINGSVDQTVLDLQTILKKTNSKASSHRIQDSISNDDDAELVKSVLTAKKEDGTFVNIAATDSENLKVTDAEGRLAIAKGEVTGTSSVSKFGENPEIDTASVPEDIWDIGGLYTFSTTADIDSISSSSIDDTQEISIQGLDSNWELVSQTITLNGQTRVALTTPLVRCFRAYNSNGTETLGDVYIYVNGAITGGIPDDLTTVRAYIAVAHQQTMMCIYTIPENKTGYLMASRISLSNSKVSSATMTLKIRNFGGVFRTGSKVAIQSTGTSSFLRDNPVPGILPAKTDILVRCEEVTANGTAIAGGFDIVLVDN